MDAVTKSMLFKLSALHPRKAIYMTHQFLDGYDGKECGCVPPEWDGGAIYIFGQWWRTLDPTILDR